MRVFLNPNCDYGQGKKKWERLAPEIQSYWGNFKIEEIESPGALPAQLKKAALAGERFFVAAGGDGTVNLVANALLELALARHGVVLGAIGLGSSNDFHKPFKAQNFIEDVPVRLDRDQSLDCDLIQVKYKKGAQPFQKRYCLINASIGITAEANAFYNSRQTWLEFIQRFSVEAAIVASALKTIFTFRNIPSLLNSEYFGLTRLFLTNLSVIKNPHFAGGLCYDTIINPDDGKMEINLCYDMSRLEAVKTLVKLYKHRFIGQPKTESWSETSFSISSRRPFALEMDGEVVEADYAEFSLIPQALRCCR